MLAKEIVILPMELQNQIAAGEVVERPSSVVKELVENSLDAGATKIDLSLEQAGFKSIIIRDNGFGILPKQLELAVTRHGTSKIKNFADLSAISSFGFRGEALPSIASVSKFCLTSKAAFESASSNLESETAKFIKVEHGKICEQGFTALRQGTVVEVYDLFANVPARLKFLKSQVTELKRCQESIFKLSLANLDVSFTLSSDSRELFCFPVKQKLIDRLSYFWPLQVVENLKEFEFKREDYRVYGLLGDPKTKQNRADRMLFFVNNRAVQDKLLLKACRDAYKGRLLQSEYPQVLLFMDIPYLEVDINVHPSKSEVRFRDEKSIFSLVFAAISQNLEKHFSLKQSFVYATEPGDFALKTEKEEFFKLIKFKENKKNIFPQLNEQVCEYQLESISQISPFEALATITQPKMIIQPEQSEFTAELNEEALSDELKNINIKYLGQIDKTYLLFTAKDISLLIFDQHALHEAVLYKKFKESEGKKQNQQLILPLELHLHPNQVEKFSEFFDLLKSTGFEFELDKTDCLSHLLQNIHKKSIREVPDFSLQKKLLKITSVPLFFSLSEAKDFLLALINEQVENLDDIWAMMACKTAIKAGDKLSENEALLLFAEWLKIKDAEYCPHGRPVFFKLNRNKLAQLFKR